MEESERKREGREEWEVMVADQGVKQEQSIGDVLAVGLRRINIV